MKNKGVLIFLAMILFSLCALTAINRSDAIEDVYRDVVEYSEELYTKKESVNKSATLLAATEAAQEYFGDSAIWVKRKYVKNGYLCYLIANGYGSYKVVEVQFNGQFDESDWSTAGQPVTITPKY